MLGSRIRQQQQLLPLLLLILFVASNNGGVEGFTTLRRSFTAAFAVSSTRTATIRSQLKVSTTSATNTGEDNNKTPDSSSNSNDKYEHEYEPVFDFANPEEQAVSKFDRIDDAIMGGISTSQIRQSSSANNNNENDEECCFASWSGVCRTDGGGFCGTRTLPFQDGVPLRVGNGDGFYLKARLASDNEPERRVWKLTTRVENVQRSEQLYQAMFEIPKDDNENDDKDTPNSNEWKTIRVPFESFVQVRGPRIVANGPPLNVTGGLYQIGMTMSKFQIATNTTEFFNFRPGYFELQIKEIGVYSSNKVKEAETEASTATTTTSTIATTIETPMTLTKEEAKKKRPTALKILSPVAKVFFNEKRNRRKSATKILQKRGFSRAAIIKFGFQRKANSSGIVVACAQFLGNLVSTATRFVLFWTLRIALFYPFKAIQRTLKGLKKEDKKNATSDNEKLKNPQSPMA